mmetsp:Transcript_11205/g.32506  ORF Transcript_11205/g.32506 Transcript_11205/m.32506 type:complete len:250 (+) Transcript_11205:301-1050(+)
MHSHTQTHTMAVLWSLHVCDRRGSSRQNYQNRMHGRRRADDRSPSPALISPPSMLTYVCMHSLPREKCNHPFQHHTRTRTAIDIIYGRKTDEHTFSLPSPCFPAASTRAADVCMCVYALLRVWIDFTLRGRETSTGVPCRAVPHRRAFPGRAKITATAYVPIPSHPTPYESSPAPASLPNNSLYSTEQQVHKTTDRQDIPYHHCNSQVPSPQLRAPKEKSDLLGTTSHTMPLLTTPSCLSWLFGLHRIS